MSLAFDEGRSCVTLTPAPIEPRTLSASRVLSEYVLNKWVKRMKPECLTLNLCAHTSGNRPWLLGCDGLRLQELSPCGCFASYF